MNSERVNQVTIWLEEIERTVDESVAKKLDLEKCKRMMERLSSFSSDCEECERLFTHFENQIKELYDKKDNLVEKDMKQHNQQLNKVSSHLQKQHQLVPSNYYLSIFLSLGVSLGVVFGLLIFENIGLGMPIGLSIGVALGAGLDQDAKKKGKVI